VAALERFDSLGDVSVINLGTGTGTTVRELVTAFNEVVSRPVALVETAPRPGDVAGAYTRSERARELLGWQPDYTVTEGIRHSLDWATIRDTRLAL
ncbi:MAG: UDP-glucose 4-epimerase GalE, partial [Nonomuraea sp.]|nr:UDP-glucose 4-epimerase GalE [Nonomuraea sp.]